MSSRRRRSRSSSSSSPPARSSRADVLGFHLVGLVSSFREGPMLETAIRSLAHLDHVYVFEGPVEGNPPDGPASLLPAGPEWAGRLTFATGQWETDAEKRSALIEYAKARHPGACWAVWLDGDELLLGGETLHDWLWRVSQQGDQDNPVGGWPISLVELDGSVVWCLGKCVRIDLIRSYLVSSSYVELVNGERRAFGNVPAWTVVDGPLQHGAEGRPHWRARPPLQGEPHLQHRPILRSKARNVERQHVAEERNFAGVELGNGDGPAGDDIPHIGD